MMAFRRLELRNFKALGDASLNLTDVNVLIGPNGSGKSSVLQCLLVLKQSRSGGGLQASGPLIDLGTVADLVGRTKPNESIAITLECPVDVPQALEALQPFDVQRLRLQFAAGGHIEISELQLISLDAGRSPVVIAWNRQGGEKYSHSNISLGGEARVAFRATASIGSPVNLTFHSVPVEQQQALHAYFGHISSVIGSVFVVPAVRGFDSNSYPLLDNPSVELFATRSWDEQASTVLSTIAYNRTLEDLISDFSEPLLQTRFRAKLIAGKRVAAEAVNGRAVNLVNEGFGANQLMILLAQLLIASDGSVLGIEEPEIHLHPLAQTKLCRVFVELARKQKKQIILTTHSEHILLGLLNMVGREELAPHELSVHFFDKNAPVNPEELPVDKHGRLAGGLKGFFEASIDELRSFLDAQAS